MPVSMSMPGMWVGSPITWQIWQDARWVGSGQGRGAHSLPPPEPITYEHVHVHARTVHVMHMNGHACSKGAVHEEDCQRGSAYPVCMCMHACACDAHE